MRIEKRKYQCDRSGEMSIKLHKQYEWAGDGKVWTGLFIKAKYLDKPQEQLKVPLVQADPKPLPNPRPPALGAFINPNAPVTNWEPID